MRVNSKVFTQRMDMLDTIRIPNCPSEFRIYAEKLVMMVTKPGYQVGTYHKMSELQKKLIVDYWLEFDNLTFATSGGNNNFKQWFITQATQPELLRRAVQWLISGNYFIVPDDIRNNAIKAGQHMAHSVKNHSFSPVDTPQH